MIKIILSIIFLGISVGSFVFYTKPVYIEQQDKKSQLARYDSALQKARAASNKMDSLVSARNNIPSELRDKLNVMVPVNAVDNIQLILDIEGIANKYNVLLKQVDISRSDLRKARRLQIGMTCLRSSAPPYNSTVPIIPAANDHNNTPGEICR